MILVFGSINTDLIFQLPGLPAPGQTLLAERLVIQPGGKGANQAVAAARDGGAVRMAGAVGDDSLAGAALAGLRDAGVDLAGVRTIAGTPTGCASIHTDRDGRNAIAVALGANGQVVAAQVDDAMLRPGTILLLQMEGAPVEITAVIRRARAAGCRIILNLAPAIPLAREVLGLLDFLVVNEDEAETLGQALRVAGPMAAASLAEALGIGVIRTLGAAGAEACAGGETIHVAAPAVAAVDTTAAGDCFVGVFAAAMDRGASLASAMARGCAAASLACTLAGSQRSLPDREATDRFLGALTASSIRSA
jgi:ribokinase